VTGQEHPRLSAFQSSLDVGHVAIRSLPGVARQKGVDVGCLSSLHGGRGTGKFGEDGSVVLLIPDLVAHEDNPALELPPRVAFWKFGSFFMAEFKNSANVDPFSSSLRRGLEVREFLNRTLVPGTGKAKTLPLLGHRGLGSGSAQHLHLIDRPGHKRKGPEDHVSALGPMPLGWEIAAFPVLLSRRRDIARRSGSDVGNARHGGSVVRRQCDLRQGHL